MAALLVRLKLSLIRGQLRASVWRVVGLAFAALYALGIVVLVVAGQVAARFADPLIGASITVLGFGAVTLGWTLVPLLASGIDDSLDTARFALLPVRARELMPGIVAAALVGVPGIATILAALGQLGLWSTSVLTFVATLVSVPLGILTSVLLSRVVLGYLATAFADRRRREVMTVVLLVVVSTLGLWVAGLSSGIETMVKAGPEAIRPIIDAVAWTPFAWAWSLPVAMSQGQGALAAIRLVLAVGFAALLWRLWQGQVERSLVSPRVSSGQAKAVSRYSRLETLLATSPTGAVAVRALRYWRRDPRYFASLIMVALLPVFVAVPGLMGGGLRDLRSLTSIFLAAPIMGYLMAASAATELSYDGRALWMHATTGMAGSADRAGRAVALLAITVPSITAFVVLPWWLTGRTDLALASLGVTLAVGLGGIGVGSYVGTVVHVPVAPPGGNPFNTPKGAGAASMLSMSLVLGGCLLVAAPSVVLALLGMSNPALAWASVAVGAVVGVVALWLGIRMAGQRLDRRWPELVQTVSASEE